MAGRVATAALATAALTTAVAAAPMAGQHGPEGADPGARRGHVRTARLEAELGGVGDDVPVRIVYLLEVPAGVRRVPLSSLEMGAGRLGPVEAVWRGAAVPAAHPTWDPAEGRARRGTVAVPAGAGGDSLTLELRYRVRDAVEGEGGDLRARVPVVQVAWPPAEAAAGTFRARALLPDTLHVTGTFPTVLGGVVPEVEGDRRGYAFDLQVVPGVVAVEMTTGARPFWTFARALDAAVMALLLALGLVGLRALRRGGA